MSDTKITDEQIVAAAHKACGLGRVSLTHINNEGEEVPTDVAKCFVRAIAALSPPSVAVNVQESEREAFAVWDEWWHEIENFSMRCERLDDLSADELSCISFEQGWQARAARPPAVQVQNKHIGSSFDEFLNGLDDETRKAIEAKASEAAPHSDHPLRHYDRTCPACNPDAPSSEGDE